MESEVRNRKAKPNPSDKSSRRKSPKKSSDVGHIDDRAGAAECRDDDALEQQQQPSPSVCPNERVQRSSDEPKAAPRLRNDDVVGGDIDGAAIPEAGSFRVQVHLDAMTIALFVAAFCTRIYRLSEPNNIV